MNFRTVAHIDMDAFFASIEIVKNPSLKGKPVIVGGNPDSRGVVSTCSYEARAYGVRSAMSLFEAKQRCPNAIFLEGDFSLYKEYSLKIMEIFHSYTYMVEVVSIDEAYIDLSIPLEKELNAFQLGRLIRQKIFQETQLTCSVGIASNKLVAKIASSLAKPNGLYEVPSGREAEFLSTLDIQCIPGIGVKTQLFLNRDGIKKIGQLQQMGMDALVEKYGYRGYHYYMTAIGRDNRSVQWEDQPPKSIGAETTFDKDLNEKASLLEALGEVTEKAWKRLRKHKMRTKRVSIKIRYSDFRTVSKTHTLYSHHNDLETIKKEAISLFHQIYAGDLSLRLVGVSLEQLTDGYWQPTFWD